MPRRRERILWSCLSFVEWETTAASSLSAKVSAVVRLSQGAVIELALRRTGHEHE